MQSICNSFSTTVPTRNLFDGNIARGFDVYRIMASEAYTLMRHFIEAEDGSGEQLIRQLSCRKVKKDPKKGESL
jgi:hypothetical protein